MSDRETSIRWAKTMLGLVRTPLILDVESTGLEADSELVQIGIVDLAGNVLLDALLRPAGPIPPGATDVHGLTDSHVAAAVSFPYLHAAIARLIIDRHVIAYNADFDLRMLDQTCRRYGRPELLAKRWHCAMQHYAAYYGEWNEYHGNYRWQSLTDACHQQNITVEGAHSAVADCRLTLALIKAIAEEEPTRGE